MYCVVKTDITPTGAASAGAETAPPDTTPTGAITIDTTLVPHPPVPHPPVPLPQLPYTDSIDIYKIILGQQNEQSIKTSVAYYARSTTQSSTSGWEKKEGWRVAV